jgi:hypothetical protein
MQSNKDDARSSPLLLFAVTAIFPAVAVLSQHSGFRDDAAFVAVLAYFFGFAFGQIIYKRSAPGTSSGGK